MKLIDKDKIVAELEKLIDKGKYHDNYECAFRDGNNNALYALKAKINTFEVKEVDLEKELSYADYMEFFEKYPNFPDDWGYDEARIFANYFFRLGLRIMVWNYKKC